MHILFTIANDSYVPYFNWFARKAIDNKEIKFSFLCLYPEKPRMIEDMKKYDCEVYWVKYDESGRKYSLISALPRVYSVLRKVKPDIVHSHLFDDALISMLAAKLAGVNIRVITKGDACYHYFYTPKWMFFDKLNNFLATHIIALSGENKKFILEKEGASKSKVSLIHHGIPKEDYMIKDKEKSLEIVEKFGLEGCLVFGSVGRLEENKGMKDLVKAAIILRNKGLVFKLVITGEGSQQKELEQIVYDNNLNDIVVLTGWLDESEIPFLYECFDVYVHGSHFETFGFVIAEAMMHGLPIVATKSSGAAADAIEHRRNGYLYNYGDIEALSEGMSYFSDGVDSSIAEKIKDKAVKMFEFNVMWENHLALYRKAIV